MTKQFINHEPCKELSRRDLLHGASAGVAATFAAAVLPLSVSPAAAAQQSKPAASLTPASMPKGFSRAEMERRWKNVRERMKHNNFDCLIVPERPEGNADIKYLTEMPAGWVVFPLNGKVTAITADAQTRGKEGGNEGPEIETRGIEEDGVWSPAVIDVLREKNMAQARIGVGFLVDVFRNGEGGVSSTTLDRIRKAFPGAQFSSAVDLLMRAKLSRSAEEIAVLEKASEVSEAGLQAMMDTARPGAVHRDVWLAIYKALVSASGELPTRVAIRAGAEANTSGGHPLEEKLKAGQILNQEISGTVLGYGSQVNQSVCVGSPAPADWPDAAKYCMDLYQSLVDWIVPGKSFKDFLEFYRAKAEARGGGRAGSVVFHTGGANDGPRWGPTRKEGIDLVLETGMVFTMKPRVPIKNTSPFAQYGDPIVVTDKGARRLGKRKFEIKTVGV
jgi:Xaa-Pro dipeptidase